MSGQAPRPLRRWTRSSRDAGRVLKRPWDGLAVIGRLRAVTVRSPPHVGHVAVLNDQGLSARALNARPQDEQASMAGS
jgi:hypothetical protein